jgi:hypothetical protein
MKKPTRKQVLTAAAVLAVLLVFLGLWLFRPDPQVAKVQALQRELFGEAGRKLDPAERRQRWQAFNAERQKLTPGQRRDLGAEFRKRRQAEAERYFKLSKAEQTRWLDEQINRMEEGRRRAQANGGFGGGPPGRGRGNLSPEEREQRRRANLDQTTPEQRAQRDQIVKELNARRTQRGLGPMGFGRVG